MLYVPNPERKIKVYVVIRWVSLNVVNDAYSMHWIKDHLNDIAGAMVFTTLDLNKGYQQLLINEES